MKKIFSLILTGSLFFSLAPYGLAEEAPGEATANPNSAASITDKTSGPCAGLTGFEQGRCLRTELRKRILERRMGRRALRILRKTEKKEVQTQLKDLHQEKKEESKTIRKGYWTLKKDIIRQLHESLRAKRRAVWERVQERIRRLKEQEPTSEAEEEEEQEEPEAGSGETSERVQITTKKTVKFYYNLRGRGQSRRLRRMKMLLRSTQEAETEQAPEEESSSPEEETTPEEGESSSEGGGEEGSLEE